MKNACGCTISPSENNRPAGCQSQMRLLYFIFAVAERYHLKAVYLFGSYARRQATAESDIDLLVDTRGTNLNTLMKLGGLYSDLEDALGKPIDLITVSSLEQEKAMPGEVSFRHNVWKEKVNLYVAA